MSSSLNETELQKLVDGELDLPATKQLLKSAEAEPNHWRKIAVAFVEDKLWQRSFQLNDSLTQSVNKTPTRVAPKPEMTAKVNSAPTATKLSPPTWFALAAGLLLAVGVGYLAGSKPFTKSDVTVATSTPTEQKNLAAGLLPVNTMTLADLQPEYQLELTDASGAGSRSVPLYSARKLNQLPQAERRSLAGTTLSDRQRQQLYQSGYQVQQNVDYLSGRLQDGRAFVVPVRTVNLSSGQ